MNGSEHYREAERLLERSKKRSESDLALADADAIAAQAHATLALVKTIEKATLKSLGAAFNLAARRSNR